jgi:DNA-binding FrmR family transcriptional regulator
MNETHEAAVQDLMRDVDRTLLRENLKLTFERRVQKHLRVSQMVEELRRAGEKLRRVQKADGR